MSAIGVYNLTIIQGATFAETWKRSDVASAIDWHAKLDIRAQPERQASTLLLSISDLTADDLIALSSDGVRLIMALTIRAVTTALLDFDTAYYDLKLTKPDSTVEYLLEGKVILNRRITT